MSDWARRVCEDILPPAPPKRGRYPPGAPPYGLRTRDDDSPSLCISSRGILLERRSSWHLIQKYGKQTKLPKAKPRFRALRHALTVHLLDAGADVAFVQDRLGHAHIQNTIISIGEIMMARYRVQLRSYFKHPDPKVRVFDFIMTNDDIRHELNSGRKIVHVKSASTQLQFQIPVDIIAYVADLSTLGSG